MVKCEPILQIILKYFIKLLLMGNLLIRLLLVQHWSTEITILNDNVDIRKTNTNIKCQMFKKLRINNLQRKALLVCVQTRCEVHVSVIIMKY